MTESPCPYAATLVAYVEGHLDDEQLAAVSKHLVDCEQCYETVATRARSLSASWNSADVEPSLALMPALLTATVMAAALTVCLLLLTHPL